MKHGEDRPAGAAWRQAVVPPGQVRHHPHLSPSPPSCHQHGHTRAQTHRCVLLTDSLVNEGLDRDLRARVQGGVCLSLGCGAARGSGATTTCRPGSLGATAALPLHTSHFTYLLPELSEEKDAFLLEEPIHGLEVLQGGHVLGGVIAPRAALGVRPWRRHAAQQRVGSHCEPTQSSDSTGTSPPSAHLGARASLRGSHLSKYRPRRVTKLGWAAPAAAAASGRAAACHSGCHWMLSRGCQRGSPWASPHGAARHTHSAARHSTALHAAVHTGLRDHGDTRRCARCERAALRLGTTCWFPLANAARSQSPAAAPWWRGPGAGSPRTPNAIGPREGRGAGHATSRHTHLSPPMYHTGTPPRKPLTPVPSTAHTTHARDTPPAPALPRVASPRPAAPLTPDHVPLTCPSPALPCPALPSYSSTSTSTPQLLPPSILCLASLRLATPPPPPPSLHTI